MLVAHGVASRADLPISPSLALYGSGVVVLLSFAAASVLWTRARLGGTNSGRPMPRPVQQLLDAPAGRLALRAVTLVLSVLVLTVALLGPAREDLNLAPYAVYVTFWVGLVPASLLLGPVWRVLNPLRLLHTGLTRLTGPPRAAHLLPRLGYWPAAAALTVFVWLELVYPDRADPRTVGVFLLCYAVVQLAGGALCGPGWFDRGDAFEVYSALLGRLSPLGRRDDGRLVLRSPLAGPSTLGTSPGLVAVVVVLLGSTAFDGLSRTRSWTGGPGAADDALSGTAGLTVMIAVVGVLFVGGAR